MAVSWVCFFTTHSSGQVRAAGAVAGPVREHERGLRGVADHAAVGAAVGQAEGRPRVQQHLAGRLEAARRVVEDRQVEQRPAVVVEHRVVGDLDRACARSRRPRRRSSARRSARSRAGCRASRSTRRRPSCRALGRRRVGLPLDDRPCAPRGRASAATNSSWLRPRDLSSRVGGDEVEQAVRREVAGRACRWPGPRPAATARRRRPRRRATRPSARARGPARRRPGAGRR